MSFGLAFNIDPNLNYFGHVVPSRIIDKEVTSLKREIAFVLPAEGLTREQLIFCFGRIFGYNNVIRKQDALSFSYINEIE
ncbi:Octanoyltransferase protein [Spatholobus suberectus]|nr:Octanoyltransferase protein [Spatholobus suberectus]